MTPDGYYELPDCAPSIDRWRESRNINSISGWLNRDALLQNLRAAINAVNEYGEDSYICDGLSIAIKIIEAGPNVDVKHLIKNEMESGL